MLILCSQGLFGEKMLDKFDGESNYRVTNEDHVKLSKDECVNIELHCIIDHLVLLLQWDQLTQVYDICLLKRPSFSPWIINSAAFDHMKGGDQVFLHQILVILMLWFDCHGDLRRTCCNESLNTVMEICVGLVAINYWLSYQLENFILHPC